VVGVLAADPGPAQVIGDPLRLDACGERLHLAQVLEVKRRGAADRERHAVHRQRIALAKAREVVQRATAADQVVLGEYLEPVDPWSAREDRLVVIDSEAQPEAERRTRQHARGGPDPWFRARPAASYLALALAASQSALLISRNP